MSLNLYVPKKKKRERRRHGLEHRTTQGRISFEVLITSTCSTIARSRDSVCGEIVIPDIVRLRIGLASRWRVERPRNRSIAFSI